MHLTSDLGSLKQHQKKMPFQCHLWFSLFFLICLSSQSVLCVPLDRAQLMMTLDNPDETEKQSPIEDGRFPRLYMDHQVFSQIISQSNSGSFQSSAPQPNQKMSRINFTPTNSIIDHDDFERQRRKSSGPSLSIVNPMDVLRQRLLLEIARRRRHSQQINANTEFLKTIGKRRRRDAIKTTKGGH